MEASQRVNLVSILPMSTAKKILFVSAECAPFAKTGGLADVCGSLPKALAALGHEVRVVLPFYKTVRIAGFGKTLLKTGVTISALAPESGIKRVFQLRKDLLPGAAIPIYMIDQPEYFERDRFYGDESGDFSDNLERFSFFAHAALAAAESEGFKPDIIHCHDWHTGLIPAYLHTLYAQDKTWKNTGTLFTIHNLAYQGLFPEHLYGRSGLPGALWNTAGVEFYGQLNLMKAGLRFANRVNTVSPRYAEEIQGVEMGCGLDGVLVERKADLSGIINGLDYSEWSPDIDPHLSTKYSKDSLDLKLKYKHDFISSLKLDWNPDVPLLGVVSRLDNMKGLNLLEEIMDYLVHMDLNFVLLGTGDPRYMESFNRIGQTYPDKASIHLTFSNELAHKIEAASDIFLMPSRFEPCGLNQLISLRYGTVPVVRATGGLADTVKEFDPKAGTGNGFVFHEFNSMGLFNAIKRAVELYQNKEKWRKLQLTGMNQDFSWTASARHYSELYKKITNIAPSAEPLA
jgi:starch synthase